MKDLVKQVETAVLSQGDMIDLRGRVDTMDEAYAIQDQTEAALISAKGPVVGRKIAWNNPELMKLFGANEPVVARMYQSGLLQDGATLRLSDNPNMAIEPELCVTLGQDIEPNRDLTLADMPDVIESIVPAFEILNRRNVADIMHPETIVAHNILWAQCVMGRSEGDADPMLSHVRMSYGDEILFEGHNKPPQSPAEATLFVLENLQSRGHTIAKGEVIICGSYIPPFAVKEPGIFHFCVEGVGAVSLSISD